MEGEYTAHLNFTMATELLEKNHTFEVTNTLGTTSIEFQLESEFKPEFKPDENYEIDIIGLEKGKSSMVEITFKAFPMPNR